MTEANKPKPSAWTLVDFFDTIDAEAAAAAKATGDAAAALVAEGKAKQEKEARTKELDEYFDAKIGSWAEENLEPPAKVTTTTTKTETKK